MAAWSSALVFLAGCTSTPQAAGPSPSGAATSSSASPPVTATERLDCNAIDDTPPPADYKIVLDSVAVRDPDGVPLQASEYQAQTGVLRYFAKTGLGVRVGAEWLIRVPDDQAAHLRIGWGAVQPGLRVGSPRCSQQPTSRSGWLWYPGGFWTDQPGCRAVTVEAHGTSTRLSIPVGAACSR